MNGGIQKTRFEPSLSAIFLLPHSRKLFITNTQKGLFQSTRLEFGVHSASPIFHRELESRLASIIYLKVPSENILISGKNDFEYFENSRKA